MFIKSLFLLVSIYVVDGEPDKDSVKIYDQYLAEDTCLHMASHLQEVFKRPEIAAKLDKLDVTGTTAA